MIDERTDTIRRLNDELRQKGRGGAIVITTAIANLPNHIRSRLLAQVMRYNEFDPCNDPYREHDFGAFTIDQHCVFFKIDYFDETLTMHSPDPADPDVTRRVLTIMLAHEW
jgi:hypothetical protein